MPANAGIQEERGVEEGSDTAGEQKQSVPGGCRASLAVCDIAYGSQFPEGGKERRGEQACC